ncbi:MAG: sulfotransferase family protein, partial [Proteobacteria bacterium]|nr:sulfotransferase family protein [Pseudomonadota bacterium]
MTRDAEGILMPSGLLGYYDLPKCASTSIKSALHVAEFGFPFENRKRSVANSGPKDIHRFWATNHRSELSSAQQRIIVVRDPVERFLSAYANRVTAHRALSRGKITHGNG